MDFSNTVFKHIDWSKIESITKKGEMGTSVWKEVLFPNFRAAVAEISSNYRSAELCSKGHVLYCIEGELTIIFTDGREVRLSSGDSLIHGEGEPHIAETGEQSAKIFVVD